MRQTTAIRLKRALDIRCMKQIDLVEKTAIGKSAISQYLSGSVVPKQDKVYAIAIALNVNPAWLMGYDVSMEPNEPLIEESRLLIKTKNDPKAQKLLSCYFNLGDDRQDMLVNLAETLQEANLENKQKKN